MLDTAKNYYLMWIERMQENPAVLSAIGLALVVAVLYFVVFVRKWPVLRETPKMSAHERRLNETAADAITDGLENAVYEGRLTRKEVKRIYKKLADTLSLADLLPRKNVRELKHEIKGRLMNGHAKPAPLPDAEIEAPPMVAKKEGFGLRH